ncbi:MAG: SPOR domain-containing protein [Proteobacteria bacterium]|nr:SPOR domain-containing protein [Pseudomonadota bacterium]
MFQRMADQVAAIQVDSGDGSTPAPARPQALAQAEAKPAPMAIDGQALDVRVVDALDMPNARDAGLRPVLTAVSTLTHAAASANAGLRGVVEPAGRASPGKSVQLAAFPNDKAAHAAWAALQAKSPALLGRLRPEFDHVDLGPKGVWVRIKAGPVVSAADAKQVCAAAGVAARWCASAFNPQA